MAGIRFNLPLNLELGVNCRYQDRAGSFTDTDGQYFDYGCVPQPGFWAIMGITMTLDSSCTK